MTGSLMLGAVDLMDGGAYKIHALGPDSGTTFGNPTPITEQLESFLQYGSIVVNSGWESREMVIVVRIKGNGVSMAASAAALFAEIGKPNTLVYTAPAAGSVPQVFRVEFSQLEDTLDDVGEIRSGQRVYTIRLTCDAFVYSSRLTTVPALAASGSTTTNVDSGSSASGWTATVNGSTVTPTAVTGPPTTVTATSATTMSGDVTVMMTRAGTITTSAQKILVVDWKPGAGVTCSQLNAVGNGASLQRIADTASPTVGFTRSWFSVSATSITSLQLLVLTSAPTGDDTFITRSLSIDNISVTDVRPGSAKQQARTLAISGSAPTTGSLAVQHATTGLGDVLVYTCPDDGGAYYPPCRNYFSGSQTADAAASSGFYTAVVGGAANLTVTVPATALPSGEYLVMLSARSITTDSTLGVTISTTAPVGTLISAAPVTVPVVATSGYVLSRVAMLHLPQVDVASTGAIVLSIQNTAAGVTCRVDDVYLFNLTTGRMTQVACGSATRLWIDSPSFANDGLGRYLLGSLADRSDAYSAYPSSLAIGVHVFQPPSLKVFTVATNPSTTADVALTYYAAWSHHAAS